MGARDVKRRQCPQLLFQLGLSVVVLHLVLGSGSFVNCNNTNSYEPSNLKALQAMFAAWNTSTPDQSTNLAGWSSSQRYPCQSLSNVHATTPNYRGVFCLKHDCNNTDDCYVDIVGLSLSNASIVGTLPPEVGNLSWLTTLELTGNPGLTGPLPGTLGDTWINILDVHDNGFNGTIPDLQYLWNLLQLDLSGNNFTGGYPVTQLSSMDYLQILSIGRNRLTGEIQADAFVNKTELEKLDISDNLFTGPLPKLNFLKKYLNYLDVSGNHFEGPLPNLTEFKALRHVNLGRNRFTGTANLLDILNLNVNTTLAVVDLSHNQLKGPLPSWNASSLGSIQELYLDNNNISGTLDIPQMLRLGLLREKSSADNSTQKLGTMKISADNSTPKLGIMSLSNTSIEHVIYDPNIIANIATAFILQGTPYCTNFFDSSDDGQRCYCTQVCFVTPLKTDSRKIIIIAVTTSVLAASLILLVVVGAILYKNRRYKQYLQLEFKQKFEEFDVKPTIFSYNELRAATRDFHEDMKLGQGGYGAVYKGVLPNGNVVAVKQLYIKTAQGLDEFSNEVVLITGMKHRNLVNLKGCCLREHQRLLVYEYVDNYDVDQILLGSRSQVVSWPERLKICLGIARGLHYLHALAHPRVIHRDIKASNVLLDKNLEPKIADFGLALLFPDEQSHIMTVHVAGTKGYLAPEYAALGQLSDKVDVYSFGVLCLEIISGRRNIDETAPLDQVYLSKYAWLLYEEDRLLELVDPSLRLSDEEMRDVQRVINVCLLCIQNGAEKRPTMARIVSILQSDTESEIQVLGEGKGEPSYKSTRSQKSVDYKRTGLESVSEEGGPSNGTNGKSQQGQDDLSIAVELSEIRAR